MLWVVFLRFGLLKHAISFTPATRASIVAALPFPSSNLCPICTLLLLRRNWCTHRGCTSWSLLPHASCKPLLLGNVGASASATCFVSNLRPVPHTDSWVLPSWLHFLSGLLAPCIQQTPPLMAPLVHPS